MKKQELLTISAVSAYTKITQQKLRHWDKKHKNNKPISEPYILPVNIKGKNRKYCKEEVDEFVKKQDNNKTKLLLNELKLTLEDCLKKIDDNI
jgi:DNA-binding transcriptional MerR regulator